MTTRLYENSVEINAPASAVWELIGDLRNATQWSNSAIKVLPIGGDTKNGTFAININKMGKIVWPTTSKVVDYQPERRLANRVINGTVWVFELAPGSGGSNTTTTLLTEYCEYPDAILDLWGTKIPKWTKNRLQFVDVQEKGVSDSLAKIKQILESRGHAG